jgi:hypothetical protein
VIPHRVRYVFADHRSHISLLLKHAAVETTDAH